MASSFRLRGRNGLARPQRPRKVSERSGRKLLCTLKEIQSKNILPAHDSEKLSRKEWVNFVNSQQTNIFALSERARLRLLTSQRKGASDQ